MARAHSTIRLLTFTLVLFHDAIGSRAARAQSVFEVRPLLATAQVYDSNLFYTTVNPQADFITRVSPGVLSEYRSRLLVLRGRYTFDAERFANHPELSGMDARQHAGLDLSYRPTRRMTLAADADYSATQTPSELTAETGLLLARARAERLAAHSSMTVHISRSTAGTVDYLLTQDHIENAFAVLTRIATIGGTHRLSSGDTITAGYQLHQYVFGTSSPTSHGLHLGWTRALSTRSTFTLDGGPRVTDGAPAAELSASVRYQFRPGAVAFDYARTQTTVLGLTGTADTQRIGAIATWTPRRSLRMHVAPAFFHSAHGMRQADVYRLSIDVSRRLAPGVSIDAVMNAYVQHGQLWPDLPSDTIPHNDIAIRLVVEPARSR